MCLRVEVSGVEDKLVGGGWVPIASGYGVPLLGRLKPGGEGKLVVPVVECLPKL